MDFRLSFTAALSALISKAQEQFLAKQLGAMERVLDFCWGLLKDNQFGIYNLLKAKVLNCYGCFYRKTGEFAQAVDSLNDAIEALRFESA